jgi:endonuclease-3
LERAEEILRRLLSHYERTWRPSSGDPFRSLIRIILSQNTNYKNEATAYRRLEEMVGVEPLKLASASTEDVAEAIRPAGMYNQRSRVIKGVAEIVFYRYGGDLGPVLQKPHGEAREELMTLPGVGPKTADVLLMFDAGKTIVPVDRHIFRITKRWGLVPERAPYDQVRLSLEAATPPGRHEDVHVFLISFGREVCKAQRPKCPECFLNDLCPFPRAGGDAEDINGRM